MNKADASQLHEPTRQLVLDHGYTLRADFADQVCTNVSANLLPTKVWVLVRSGGHLLVRLFFRSAPECNDCLAALSASAFDCTVSESSHQDPSAAFALRVRAPLTSFLPADVVTSEAAASVMRFVQSIVAHAHFNAEA